MSYYDSNNTTTNATNSTNYANSTDYPNYTNYAKINNNTNPNNHTNTNYYDFNTAEEQTNYDLIPKGTLAKVRMQIKRGFYNDESRGWTGGYATKSRTSDAIYLACEFTVTEGEYAKRKIWSNIGLYSARNDNLWGALGRSFIKSILNSAKGLTAKDQSESAKAARKITSFGELEGLEFVAKIELEGKDDNGNSNNSNNNNNSRNIVKAAIGPEHAEYNRIMGQGATGSIGSIGSIGSSAGLSTPPWA